MFKLNKNVAVNEAWAGEKLTLPFERTNQTVNAILAAWATTHLHRRWRPWSVHLQFQLNWTNHSHMHNTGHTKSLSVVWEAFWKCRDVPLWMCSCVSTSEEIQETGIRDWEKCELAFTTWTYVNLLDHVDTRRCDLGQRWATFLNRGTSSWVGIDPGSCLVRAVFI